VTHIIDAGISDLIEALWETGVEEDVCCEEAFPGVASISFSELAGMQRLYNILAPSFEDDTLFDAWQWKLSAENGLWGTLQFPRSHIKWVTQRIKEWTIDHEEEVE